MTIISSDPLRVAALAGIFGATGILHPSLKVFLVTSMPSDLGSTLGSDLANAVSCGSSTTITITWDPFVDENNTPGYVADAPVDFTMTADVPDQFVVGFVLVDAGTDACLLGTLFDAPIPMQFNTQKLSVTPRAVAGLVPLGAVDFVQ